MERQMAVKTGFHRTIVGVMGSGKTPYEELASPLGQWLGSHGYNLLTGGGQGVMAAVSKAFASVSDREGIIIGIIPAERLYEGINRKNFLSKPGYPNKWVDVPILTHLPLTGVEGKENLSRNHINILTSDIIIALPGNEGTLSEIELSLEYKKTLIIFDPYFRIADYSKEGAKHCRNFPEVISILHCYPAITEKRSLP